MKITERLIGLDYGDKTIGVAVSDPLGTVALGVETIRRSDEKAMKPSIHRLSQLLDQYAPIRTVVLGFPKRMDNTEGERCRKTLAFKEKLERRFKQIKVELWDERFSTVAVKRTLQKTEAIDEMAAVFILQGYMDYQRKRRSMTDFDSTDFDSTDTAITMFDDGGNEVHYQLLATKEAEGCMYMLAEEIIDEKESAEVLIFKRVNGIEEDDEDMVFELMDEEHSEFNRAFALFEDDFELLGIEG